jgi:hypothetical protein
MTWDVFLVFYQMSCVDMLDVQGENASFHSCGMVVMHLQLRVDTLCVVAKFGNKC